MNSEPNFTMWLVTSVIALLAAGGGVVAYLRYFQQPKLKTRLWMLDNPYYQLHEDGEKLAISRSTRQLPGPAQVEAESIFPVLHIDVTNPTDKRIAINAVKIHFSQISKLKPPTATPLEIVIQYRDGVTADRRDMLARKYGLQLTGTEDDFYTYQLKDAQAANVVMQIVAESDVVERAFTNEPGKPHKDFSQPKKVDVKLEPERKDYTYLIAETISAHDAFKIGIFIGASESLTGSASVELIYNTNKSHSAGELELTVEVPDFVRTIEAPASEQSPRA